MGAGALWRGCEPHDEELLEGGGGDEDAGLGREAALEAERAGAGAANGRWGHEERT